MVECECLHPLLLQVSFRRFNRYMVECELLFSFVKNLCTLVLIDTWWNVNVYGFTPFRMLSVF